jgi:hypothetical protein
MYTSQSGRKAGTTLFILGLYSPSILAQSSEDWVNGNWNAPVLNSDSTGAYTSPSGIYGDSKAYAAIDTDATAETMTTDLSMDIFVSSHARRYSSIDYDWLRLVDFAYDRRNSGYQYWPTYIVSLIEEPDESGYTYEQVWTDDYVGNPPSTGFTTGFEVLDDYYNNFESGLTSPDALALDEVCNWAETAHRPYSVYNDRVETSDVRTFIDTIQAPQSSGGLEREAWAYFSETAAMMIGIESWVLGPMPADPYVGIGSGDYVGVEMPFPCARSSTQRGGVTGQGFWSGDYYEILMGVELSYLHMDTTADADGNFDWDLAQKKPFLTTHITRFPPFAPQTFTVPMDETFDYQAPSTGSSSSTSDTESFPFYSARLEGVQLLQEDDLFRPRGTNGVAYLKSLTCGVSSSSVPNTLTIRANCNSPTTPICASNEDTHFGYIADVERAYHTINNCSFEQLLTITSFPSGMMNSPYVTDVLPSVLSNSSLPNSTDDHIYVEVTDFFPTLPAPAGPTLYFKIPAATTEEAAANLAEDMMGDLDLDDLPFCFNTFKREYDLDAQTPVAKDGTTLYPDSAGPFLSVSNEDYRYLDRLDTLSGVLDSVIVRHAFATTVDEYHDYFDVEAQQRLMEATQEAVVASNGYYSLSYLETNTWVYNFDHDWIVDYLGNVESSTNGLIGGRYSMSWWKGQSSTSSLSEFAPRTELHQQKDARLNTTNSNHEYDVRFHYPEGRKSDTVPGMYQKVEGSVTVTFGQNLSFEWDVGACSGCESQDLVMEVYIEQEGTSNTYGPYVWVIGEEYNDSNDEDSIYQSGITKPEVTFSKTISGDDQTYNVEVYLFTTGVVSHRRDVYFRMVDLNDTDQIVYGPTTYDDVPLTVFEDDKDWDFTSGIMSYDSGSGIYPVDTYPTDIDPDTFDDVWDQSSYLMNCLGTFFSGGNWGNACQ